MKYTNHYKSPIGDMTLASDGNFLTGLWFDGQKYFPKISDSEEKELPIFNETKQWLDIYFSGNKPNFTPKLKMVCSDFRKNVWEIMLTIPFGQTMTYGEIAEKIAKERWLKRMSSQAIGGAVGHNSIAIIIPCHRVLGANGNLTGYTGGIDKKIYLLKNENVNF